MNIRTYRISDTQAIMQLFYDTIHTINRRDYTKAQIDAWAPETMEVEAWVKGLSHDRKVVYVAEVSVAGKEQIIGFGELENDGHIDCFYCHKDFQGQGVGTQLLQQIESDAQALGLQRLFVEVSITAKPFFEKRGFVVLAKQAVQIRGQSLINFRMEKWLKL